MSPDSSTRRGAVKRAELGVLVFVHCARLRRAQRDEADQAMGPLENAR
jgi:hypothetical protein